jgi:hypothetical protein
VICPWKVCEGLETTLRSTTSDWAPTSWRRLKEKKVSLRGVWVPFVGIHASPMVTNSAKGVNIEIHLRLCVPRLSLSESLYLRIYLCDSLRA